jgi:hypothetical protein
MINVDDLNTETVYYWHSCYNSNVIPVKYLRLNGNTFMFQIENKDSKLGLSCENKIIYGLSRLRTINFFEYWKYQQ